MERPTCGTCPYWDNDAESKTGFGECRKHAPTKCSDEHEVESRDKDEADIVFWPRTFDADWCGEHPLFPAYIAGLNQPDAPSVEEVERRLLNIDARALGILRNALHHTKDARPLCDFTYEWLINNVPACGPVMAKAIMEAITSGCR